MSSVPDYSKNSVLGRGVHGIVFDFNHDAIKVCISTDYSDTVKTINAIKRARPDEYVHVKEVCTYENGYTYLMERLNCLSADEERLFHTLMSHEDRCAEKDLSCSRVDKIVDELSQWLDFDPAMVKFFCKNVRVSKFRHLDIHPRNILKTNTGFYKLIDLERVAYNEN